MTSDQYRVGRRCPWNVYRINPANENRDHDDRFAVTFEPADGPLVVAALNAYQGATNPAAPAPLDGRLTDADDYGRLAPEMDDFRPSGGDGQ